MSKFLLTLLQPPLRKCAAMAAIAMIAGYADAQPPQPLFMNLGGAAPAPLGYLRFCARMPEQCGLTESVDAGGRPITADQRDRELNAKYYWSIVFGSDQAPAVGLTPTSGAVAPSEAVRFDWSTIFGTSTSAEAGMRPLETNPSTMAELARVNLLINRAIRYVPDQTLYGDEDYWHLPLDGQGPAAGDCKDYVLEKRRALIADGVPAADLSIAIAQVSQGETHAVLLVTTDRGEVVLDSLSSAIKPWQAVRYRWIERQAPGQQLSWVKLG